MKSYKELIGKQKLKPIESLICNPIYFSFIISIHDGFNSKNKIQEFFKINNYHINGANMKTPFKKLEEDLKLIINYGKEQGLKKRGNKAILYKLNYTQIINTLLFDAILAEPDRYDTFQSNPELIFLLSEILKEYIDSILMVKKNTFLTKLKERRKYLVKNNIKEWTRIEDEDYFTDLDIYKEQKLRYEKLRLKDIKSKKISESAEYQTNNKERLLTYDLEDFFLGFIFFLSNLDNLNDLDLIIKKFNIKRGSDLEDEFISLILTLKEDLIKNFDYLFFNEIFKINIRFGLNSK